MVCSYGNPAQAHYRSLPLEQQQLQDVDMFDTFLDAQHLTQSFPTYKVSPHGAVRENAPGLTHS